MLESRGLKKFCSMKSVKKKTLDDLAVEFLTRATYKKDSIKTKVRVGGKKEMLEVSISDMAEIFGISNEGVDPFSYKREDYLESFRLMARSSHQDTIKNLK